uniref:RNA-dependent RNA polymerase n=1 Tax=Mycena chlorophos TaxID=658473 RepID=A0ABQ0M9D6_MYCCL|nr:predicted protein [Mycena chlorophos]
MHVNRPSLSFSIEDDITAWGALVPSQMLRVEPADPPAPNLSQHSSFSDIEDISHLILEAPVGTQLVRAMDASKFKKDASFARTDSTSSAGSSSGSSKQWSANTSLTSVGSADLQIIATTSSVKLEMLPGPEVSRKRKLSDSEAPQAGPKPPKVPKRESSPEDEPVIISHSPSVQRTFNNLEIPYGVQFEINRLAIRHGFDALQATALEALRGKTTAESIPLIPGLFGQQAVSTEDAFAKEIASKAPWAELDIEEKHLSNNPLAGIGMFPETEGWFGGKVHFRGTIGESYKVLLKPPELGTSSRFARRFGSCRILTLGLDKKLMNANSKNGGTKLLNFLRRPFILGGCVFRAFDAKDGNVFFFATNEIVEGSNVNRIRTIPGLLSLPEFLNWHNPIILDVKQTMAKWAARYALGRSNSIPALRLEEGAIGAIPDIKSSTGSDMTDGAGTINKAGLRLIDKGLKPEAWPTAVQVRVAGAKGLLVMDPDDAEDTPRIALRPSQIKVQHDLQKLSDPTLRTIDLLRTANCRTSCRLSVETIINLADNGVPTSVFLSLVEAAMIRLVTPLITWEGPHAMEKLWDAVARTGGVIPARLARQETVLARQKGYYEQKIEEEEEEDADNQPSSIAWWVDEISGCPSSLEETVLALLDPGFRPETCSVLRAKLEKVVDSCLNRYVESYRIDLPVGKAATAFIVPDMHGVLEPGEFFLKSTRFDFVTEDGIPSDVLRGPALLTRHPCKVPTDVQKWIAVDKPELRFLTDVVVFSTKGDRRPADFLGGGDYDGDVALVIWEPSLVSDFKNAPNHYSEEPAAIGNAFSPKNETVAQFLERTKDMTADQVLREQQAYLLSAIRDVAIVGQYSTWHLNAIYTLGYRHEETIRLAYMFCKTLDGAKTGLQVLPAVYQSDRRKYDKRAPAWKEGAKEAQRGDETNLPNLQRPFKLGPFVMDEIYRHTDKKWNTTDWGRKLKEEVDLKFDRKRPHVVDSELTAPWLEFQAQETLRITAQKAENVKIQAVAEYAQNNEELKKIAQELLDKLEKGVTSDLDLIREHVKEVYVAHQKKIGRSFTKMKIERRQDVLRELSRQFAEGTKKLSMSADQGLKLMASYAYFYDCDQRKGRSPGWSRFPWDVAFRELCLIKTRATKTMKPVASGFYNLFQMKNRCGFEGTGILWSPLEASVSPKSHIASTLLPTLTNDMINYILLVSRQGKVRLSKWFTTTAPKAKAKIVKDVTQLVLARRTRMCNFLEYKDTKVVYRRYASLFFVCGITSSDNELVTLEIIHRYVEVLDRYFGNVCELDLIFNFQKAYAILDELIISGELQESSKKSVLRVVTQSDTVEEQENSEDSMVAVRIVRVEWVTTMTTTPTGNAGHGDEAGGRDELRPVRRWAVILPRAHSLIDVPDKG